MWNWRSSSAGQTDEDRFHSAEKFPYRIMPGTFFFDAHLDLAMNAIE